jgi:hypothetical protein
MLYSYPLNFILPSTALLPAPASITERFRSHVSTPAGLVTPAADRNSGPLPAWTDQLSQSSVHRADTSGFPSICLMNNGHKLPCRHKRTTVK